MVMLAFTRRNETAFVSDLNKCVVHNRNNSQIYPTDDYSNRGYNQAGNKFI
jgi:hypothetical protein